jgi:mono/diheme cytochrome c family protein
VKPSARAATLLFALLGATALAAAADAQPPQPAEQARWPAGDAKKWPRNMGLPRHHLATAWGVPAAYAKVSNPLESTAATVRHGAKIYAANCVSCHGPSGQGDGKAARNLSPPPGNLAWLVQLPPPRLDAFMYWTVIEGGGAFGTAMPAFRDNLSNDDIWAVVAYIEARLPPKPKGR